MTQPTRHTIADALHLLADLVSARKFDHREQVFQADPRQAEDIEAAMTGVYRYRNGTVHGLILDWRVRFVIVPSTVLADAFDQEAR